MPTTSAIHRRRWFSKGAVATLCSLVAASALTCLPARSSQFVRVALNELEQAPRDSGFRLGSLTWDLQAYASDPKLEPFRAFLRSHCPSMKGLAAAQCTSRVFADTFPEGAPQHEFFQPSYDPVSDLNAHMKGEAGHCVTRSGLLSTILLANSIPARVVQLFSIAGGHNIMEVWDPRWGWVAVDPTFGRMLISEDGHPRAVAQLAEPSAQWIRASPAPDDASMGDNTFYADIATQTRGGTLPVISLPEPWLYTRSGNRLASWPLRALFAQAGGARFLLGPAQTLLRALIVLFAALGAICMALAAYGQRRRSRASLVVSAIGQGPAPNCATAVIYSPMLPRPEGDESMHPRAP